MRTLKIKPDWRRVVVKVTPASSDNPRWTVLELSCGHVVNRNPIYWVKVGSLTPCRPCEDESTTHPQGE